MTSTQQIEQIQQVHSNDESKAQISIKLTAQPMQKDLDSFITAVFPVLNKSGNLEENSTRILKESYKARCKVQKSVNASNEEYDKLAGSFLEDNDLWEKIGGTCVDRNEVEKHLNNLRASNGLEPVVDWDAYHANLNPYLDKYQNDHYALIKAGFGYTNVVEVTSEGRESFYVNTGGFSYARYVGMAIYDERINEDLRGAIFDNDLEFAIETISKGADVNYSFHGRLEPLHQAASLGRLEIAQELLKRGADPDKLSRISGKDPIYYANESKDQNMQRLIYRAKRRAEEDMLMQKPSLLQAMLSGNKELVAEIMQKADSGQIIRIT